MKHAIKNLVALLLVITIGCSHYVVNSEGYVRPPEGYKFSYRKKAVQLSSTELVDTAAIYVKRGSNYYRDSEEYKNPDSYIRFYGDGRFKEQGVRVQDSIKLTDVNDVNVGIVGYYQLKGRVIKLQYYGDIDGGSDQLQFGRIDESGNVVLLHENPRTDFGIGYSEEGIKRKMHKGPFNPEVYKKVKVQGMVYTRPNW